VADTPLCVDPNRGRQPHRSIAHDPRRAPAAIIFNRVERGVDFGRADVRLRRAFHVANASRSVPGHASITRVASGFGKVSLDTPFLFRDDPQQRVAGTKKSGDVVSDNLTFRSDVSHNQTPIFENLRSKPQAFRWNAIEPATADGLCRIP